MNFTLSNEGGYFATSAELKPLLHLWSLSIEEQFYLFFPLLLLFFKRSNKLLWVLAGITSLSFLMNIIGTYRLSPLLLYFSPFTRGWQLLLGGLYAYIILSKVNFIRVPDCLIGRDNLRSSLGLAMIVSAGFLLSKDTAYPSWAAILPTLGALLLISASEHAWINKRILSLPSMVFIGLISYPLYLWHWSLLSFLNILNNGITPTVEKLSALLVALLLAWVTYTFVEKPIQKKRKQKMVLPVLIVLMILIGLLGWLIRTGKVHTRLSESKALKPIFSAMHDWNFPEASPVILKGKKSDRVLFIGDSFIEQYYSRVKKVVDTSDRSLSVAYYGIGGCPPLPNISRIANPGGCKSENDLAYLEAKKEDVKKVVFGSAWHYFYPITDSNKQRPVMFEYGAMMYRTEDSKKTPITPSSPGWNATFSEFQSVVLELTEMGKQVYLVLPSPLSDELDPNLMIDRIENKLIDRKGISKADYQQSFSPINIALIKIANETNAKLLDPSIDLCRNDFCSAFYKGMPIYIDTGHIRPYYVRDHISIFDKVLINE